ncbi:hypothetical protein CULT_1930005 [[Clostridium] ultunense Esp]|nr:hypothetical protein CULT_1930005 [[Clostridium] ultunense Esp]
MTFPHKRVIFLIIKKLNIKGEYKWITELDTKAKVKEKALLVALVCWLQQ